jgi:hypothetical protein
VTSAYIGLGFAPHAVPGYWNIPICMANKEITSDCQHSEIKCCVGTYDFNPTTYYDPHGVYTDDNLGLDAYCAKMMGFTYSHGWVDPNYKSIWYKSPWSTQCKHSISINGDDGNDGDDS